MKYTATITNKTIADGLLSVDVLFESEDKSRRIMDCFQTRSSQDENWLANMIASKQQNLEALDAFEKTIPMGDIVPPPTEEQVPTVELSPREQYKAAYALFVKMTSLIAQGLLDTSNPDFSALQQKLKENFKPEYLDVL